MPKKNGSVATRSQTVPLSTVARRLAASDPHDLLIVAHDLQGMSPANAQLLHDDLYRSAVRASPPHKGLKARWGVGRQVMARPRA